MSIIPGGGEWTRTTLTIGKVRLQSKPHIRAQLFAFHRSHTLSHTHHMLSIRSTVYIPAHTIRGAPAMLVIYEARRSIVAPSTLPGASTSRVGLDIYVRSLLFRLGSALESPSPMVLSTEMMLRET